MKLKILSGISVIGLSVLLTSADMIAQDFYQPYGIESLNDVDNIAPIREQVLKEEEWLRWRKKHIVPEVMKRVGIDMWLIERNERALYYSLVPANYEGLVAPRYNALIFYDRGSEEGVEEFAVGIEDVAGIVRSRDPRKISISASSQERFSEILGSSLTSRLVVTRDLRTGFLEKRSPEEISVFQGRLRYYR